MISAKGKNSIKDDSFPSLFKYMNVNEWTTRMILITSPRCCGRGTLNALLFLEEHLQKKTSITELSSAALTLIFFPEMICRTSSAERVSYSNNASARSWCSFWNYQLYAQQPFAPPSTKHKTFLGGNQTKFYCKHLQRSINNSSSNRPN